MPIIRRVASLRELEMAFDVIGAQFSPAITHQDRRFADLARRFAEDHSLMLLVTDQERIIGGALGFRIGDNVTLRIIGLETGARGRGLGRRLMQMVEVEAVTLGARRISLGAEPELRPFYESLGYRGQEVLHKELPPPSGAPA